MHVDPLNEVLATTTFKGNEVWKLEQEPGSSSGDAYTTVPWPFDTAVIGGLSQTSKYYNGINNTLFYP